MRYLIGAAAGSSLTPLVPKLLVDPAIEFVWTHPAVLVVEMPEAHARELQAQYQGRLIIERDAPLNLSTR